MFVVNVVASVLLTLVLVEAEIDASHGHLLATAEIASGRPSVWTSSALPPARAHLR